MSTLNKARPVDGPGLALLRRTIAALPQTIPGAPWKASAARMLRNLPDRDVALVAAEIAEAAAEDRLGRRPTGREVFVMVFGAFKMSCELSALRRSRRDARGRREEEAPRPKMRRRDGRAV